MNDTMTEELKQAAQMALAQIRWLAFGECRTPGWDGPPPRAADAVAALERAISQAQGGKAGEAAAVAWFEYSEQRGEWFLAYTKNPRAKTRPLVYGDTHPAPGVPEGWVPMPRELTPDEAMKAQGALLDMCWDATTCFVARYAELIRATEPRRAAMLAAAPAQKGGE